MATLIVALVGTLGLFAAAVLWWSISAPDRHFRQSAKAKRRHRHRPREKGDSHKPVEKPEKSA